MISIRNYNPNTDYPAVSDLYKNSETYGGQFDEARDSADRLDNLIKDKPDAILVAEYAGKIIGTVTLFEDGRSAWLYRFALENGTDKDAPRLLLEKAKKILKEKGHTQILVYAPAKNDDFENRYLQLGFTKGSDFTAYWQDLI